MDQINKNELVIVDGIYECKIVDIVYEDDETFYGVLPIWNNELPIRFVKSSAIKKIEKENII